MKKRMKRLGSLSIAAVMMASLYVTACGSTAGTTESADVSSSAASTEEAVTSSESLGTSTGDYFDKGLSTEDIVKRAAEEGKVGNWGLGSEYELLALLAKYGQDTTFLNQAFDMDGFDDDSLLLASVMTYNELGLVKNDYDGGYGYGDTVGVIDFNDEGVAMLEDNIFCKREFAEANPNTVKAFIAASMKGWEYACANPEEAAEICYKYGSSVSPEHQQFMADEVKKLVETDMNGETVTNYGNMNDEAMQQTLDIAKQYLTLDDSTADEAFQNLTLDDIRDVTYWEDAMSGSFDTPEQSEVSIQLKWLPDAQFMGYFVALDKGYYDEVGLTVNIISGGGDVSETTAVYSNQADFGVTWVVPVATSVANGADLLEVAQVFQRSGMEMVYKYNE